MGVGYFQGCRPVTTESNPPEISSNFFRDLRNPGSGDGPVRKAAHIHPCGEVVTNFPEEVGY